MARQLAVAAAASLDLLGMRRAPASISEKGSSGSSGKRMQQHRRAAVVVQVADRRTPGTQSDCGTSAQLQQAGIPVGFPSASATGIPAAAQNASRTSLFTGHTPHSGSPEQADDSGTEEAEEVDVVETRATEGEEGSSREAAESQGEAQQEQQARHHLIHHHRDQPQPPAATCPPQKQHEYREEDQAPDALCDLFDLPQRGERVRTLLSSVHPAATSTSSDLAGFSQGDDEHDFLFAR